MAILGAVVGDIVRSIAGAIDDWEKPDAGGGGGGSGAPTFDLAINSLTSVGQITRSDGPGDNNGVWFNPDGTKLFIMGTNGVHEINQYNLSTAWDITSAGATPDVAATYGIPTGESSSSIRCATFSHDGNNLFVCGNLADRIRHFTLTAGAWDISSGFTDVSNSLDLTAAGIRPYSMSFNYDGSAWYILDAVNNELHKFPLTGDPWDILTRGTLVTQSLVGITTNPEGGYMTPDERYILIKDGATSYALVEMLTPGDITSISDLHSTNVAFPSTGSALQPFVKTDDGAKIYAGNQNNTTDQATT